MRRLSVAPVLAGLVLALAAGGTPGTAEAAPGDRSRAGFCVEGEGLAVVLDFREAPPEQRPNDLGYEVRCLSGPGLKELDLSAGANGTQYADVPGRANMTDGTFDLTMDFSATGGTIRDGWLIQPNTPWPRGQNVDKFVGFTYSSGGPATPGLGLQPQFASPGAGGPGQNPTPGAPSTGGGGGGTPDRVGGGTPDRVGDPDRAGDDDETADPDDPEARAPGGEAGAEEAEETPEATATPESDEAVAGQSREIESTDSLTGGPTWLWVVVIALVVLVYLGVTWLVLRARKAARLAADS